MDGGRYGLALTAGMLAAVNPCGLPMLPAYLSFFVAVDSDSDSPNGRSSLAAVRRAIRASLVVSLGFMAVFGLLGAIASWVTNDIITFTPWVTVAIGVVLIGVGIALLLGRQLTFALPKLERGGRTRGSWSMFVFGVSYAIASVSCTLPVFLSQLSGTIGQDTAVGVAIFFAYSLGMALVLMALSVSVALARTGLVDALRRNLGLINRIAGGFLVVAGLYVAWYAVYEIAERNDSDPAVDRVTGWSSDLANQITNIGVYPFAGILIGVIFIAVMVGLVHTGKAADPGPTDSVPPSTTDQT